MWLCVWAWMGCGGSVSSPPDGLGSTTTDSSDSGVPVTAPPIQDVLADVCDSDLAVPSDASPDELHRMFLDDVRCNDGSPMPIFVRASTNPDASQRWVLRFEGGGSCTSGPECVDRWCGVGPYDARKMSSRFTPEVLAQSGISSPNKANAFAGYNHVFFYYCSSDLWQGDARDVVLTSDDLSLSVHYEGARAVDAALAALRLGAVSDDGQQVLPSLDEADEVWVVGSSAGGMGVTAHLDRLASELAGAQVTGLIDAFYTPDPQYVADGAFAEAFLAENRRQWEEAFVPLLDGVADASCVAAETETPWRCIDPGYVQQHHVTTPFFMHHDLYDKSLAPAYTAHGASADAYAAGAEQGLLAFASARPDVGILGSACARHTVIGSPTWFQRMTVSDDTQAWSAHDGSVAWAAGQPVVAIDAPVGSASVCPSGD